MTSKLSDGKILWLETGSSSAGLTHIIQNHGQDLINKGVDIDNIPTFIKNELLTKTPSLRGIDVSGRPFSEYLVNGNKFRLAYGNNGFIVNLFPIKK